MKIHLSTAWGAALLIVVSTTERPMSAQREGDKQTLAPVLVVSSYLGLERFEFAVTRKDLESTPRWSSDIPEPPFPPRAAIAAARTQFDTLVPDSESWRVKEV